MKHFLPWNNIEEYQFCENFVTCKISLNDDNLPTNRCLQLSHFTINLKKISKYNI
jgi:hypothetical protein